MFYANNAVNHHNRMVGIVMCNENMQSGCNRKHFSQRFYNTTFAIGRTDRSGRLSDCLQRSKRTELLAMCIALLASARAAVAAAGRLELHTCLCLARIKQLTMTMMTRSRRNEFPVVPTTTHHCIHSLYIHMQNWHFSHKSPRVRSTLVKRSHAHTISPRKKALVRIEIRHLRRAKARIDAQRQYA